MDWNWMPNTSAGFQANAWPQGSCRNAGSENLIVTAFHVPSVGSVNGSPHSSPHWSGPRTDSSHAPPCSICVEIRMTSFARTLGAAPGIAIAQNATPANPVRSYGVRTVIEVPPSITGTLKSAPTPAPQPTQPVHDA